MKKIIELKYGSHLFGTNTENSDLDLKGVFLPSKEELLSGKHPKNIQSIRKKKQGEKNTKDDIDSEMFSLDRFVELLLDGQTIAFDMLFAPEAKFTPEGVRVHALPEGKIWDELIKNKDRFLTKNITEFVGYARRQASKYGVKGSRVGAVREVLNLLKSLPPNSKVGEHEPLILKLIESLKEHVSMEKTPLVEIVFLPAHKNGPPQKYLSCCRRKVSFTNKVNDAAKVYQNVFNEYGARAIQSETNLGVDWKALSHAVRVNSEAIELLETGRITFPLPNRELILSIKSGELPYKEVAKMIEQGLLDLQSAMNSSSLRKDPDSKWAHDFVKKIYSEICGRPWPLRPNLFIALWMTIKPRINFLLLRPLRKFLARRPRGKYEVHS